MNTPDWVEPVARYVIEVGLRNTLKLSAIALVGSTVVGVVLGTLLTVRFLPLRALIRLYIAEGNRSQALRQFDRYRSLMEDELDLEPSPELADLISAVRSR